MAALLMEEEKFEALPPELDGRPGMTSYPAQKRKSLSPFITWVDIKMKSETNIFKIKGNNQGYPPTMFKKLQIL